jgi:CBS domain-containing protein
VDFQLNLNTESVELTNPVMPVVVAPFELVREVLRTMRDQKTGSVLVCRDRQLIGIFTERDALRILATGADLDVPVENVMVRNPVTITKGDTVAAAIRKMSFGGFRRLPIVDGAGHPVGLVKASSVVHYLVEHFPQMVYTLPPRPHAATHEREGA